MKKLIFLVSLIMSLNFAFAQVAQTYDWQPPKFDVSADIINEKGYILKDFRSIYFKKINAPYFRLSEKKKTIHMRIYVNSDDVIENYNKVFVPTREVSNVERLKVRTINKQGKVTDFDPANLKVLDNVEGYGEFTIFAIEGVEKGSIIEYLYEFDMTPTVFGTEFFQYDLPIQYAEIYLFGKGMAFELKGYNGAEVKALKQGKKNNAYGGIMTNIPALKEEDYAANFANNIRVDYLLQGFDWQGLSESLISQTFTKSDDKESVQKILKEVVGIDQIELKADKIDAIEKYVSENYQVIQDYNNDRTDISEIISSKFSSLTGITFLYAALFNEAEINYELVASCDRFSRKFDKDFPTPYNLDYLLFYFSDLKRFLMPYPFDYKNGLVPDFLLTQEGLSIANTYSDSKMGNHPFRFIEINNPPDFKTIVTETIDVHIKKEEAPFISVMIDLQGYRAVEFITVYNQVALDRRKEYTTFFVPQSLANQVYPTKLTLNGTDDFTEDISGTTVTIYAELPADQFIDKAGSDAIVFKLGDLIGQQMELYQEEQRTQNIELNYPVDYDRTITFNYDEGFTIEGQESIIIHTDHLPAELYKLMRFYSSFEDNGQLLKVNIDEYYHFIHMDKSHYSYFRDVINAAANFNKVSLLITYK
jgi:hypothetical protein